ncbi:CRISPR-associated endoribonuclease Cas2 [Candidatus Hepatoplasma crinochetorum Av]|uniref:CRISPR-associated endoribonuclease Cas2 n=1 Tax=Candidatus Hepatoplasma crinochetorum Av TaxID=1427984 RepID=W8GJJ0_9MOLU|nr:CRISPR-associated endonuclease Cas2 [Candidatus Hepatoplasma crinochetorum]AHK22382.1 CRISPR-associated endoribonuclease Cas2 [Candidatus Hepatoplasma crinochetorum Av]
MNILLFYDLPTITKNDQRNFNKFRNNLIKLGFIMIQESVYMKPCYNHDWVKRTKIRIKQILPEKGDIRIIIVTNKQYSEIEILKGRKSLQESYTNDEDFLII